MRFRAFGIPVTVDPFFLIGLVLVWSWAGGERAGLFAAVFVGVFTLVHELGHALTARHFGATTAITLNLLVGWASYATSRPLTRRQRNLISLAGPLTQIAAALPVLWLTHAALPDVRTNAGLKALLDGSVAYDMWIGAIWAGIIIGLLNLLPLWPLDGGHVLDSFLTGALGPRRGRRAMLISTIVLVAVIFVASVAAQNPSEPYNALERLVHGASEAPLAGVLGKSFPSALWEQVRYFPGNVLDFPFLLLIFCGVNSFLALQRIPKHDRVAPWMDVQLARPAAGAGSLARLRDIVERGTAEDIAHAGVAVYSATHDPEALYLTAIGLVRTGHPTDALVWLRRAVEERPDPARLAADPAFTPVRGHPDFQALMDEARRRS